MAKLYATLETSKGKVVSVSDNESITATVYDGNLKAYSIIIEWCGVGDQAHIRCNNCSWEGDEDELKTSDAEYMNGGDAHELCPRCGENSAGKLMDVPAVMGALVTTKEWRNQPDEKRKR